MIINQLTNGMDDVVYLCKASKDLSYEGTELGNTFLIATWISDNPAYSEGCDSVIGYCFLLEDQEECGGEMDYDSASKRYECAADYIEDILDFSFDDDVRYITEVFETTYSRFDDIF